MMKAVEALRFGEAGEYAILCPVHGIWCVFQALGEQEHSGTTLNLVDSGLQWNQSLRHRARLNRGKS